MPIMTIHLVRWDEGRKARDKLYWMDLTADLDAVGMISFEDEKIEILYHSNGEDWSATLDPDGNLYFPQAHLSEQDGFLGIVGRTICVRDRVRFVERFAGVPEEEEYEVVEVKPFKEGQRSRLRPPR